MRESTAVVRRLRTIVVSGMAAAAVAATVSAAPADASSTTGPADAASTAIAAGLMQSQVEAAGVSTIGLLPARITGKAAGAITTSSRYAVNTAYQSRYARYTNVPIGWTGSISGCRPGHASSYSNYATKRSINFVRSLNGLGPVSFSSTLSWRAMRTALMMSANQRLDHYPTSSWRCYSSTGDSTAARSNLALALPSVTSGRIVDMYMDDRGSSNTAVGHRRWVLNPFTTTMGNGSTSTANALQVVGPTSAWRANPRWTSWPSKGYFPAPLEPAGRWSLSSGYRNENFSHAVVKVWHGAKRLYPRRYAVHNGYAMPTLVWQMPAEASRQGTYKVTVSRITRPNHGYYSHTYYVRIFQPS